MPRRSLFCARAPTGLVHWYQPRLVGAHLRPHVRTRRSTERGGGRDSGKSAQLAMFGEESMVPLHTGGSPHGRGRIGKLQIALFDVWAAGSGAQPRKIFLTHFNEILKQILRTTRPTAPRWKAQIQIC